MQVTRKVKTTFNKLIPGSKELTEAELRVTEYFKMSLDELIKAGTRCVTIFDNVTDYKYSTISSEYTKVSPVDVGGHIASVNWDTNDVVLEIDDKYVDEESAYYIKPEDWDNYDLIIRGRTHAEYEMTTDGKKREFFTVVQLFGLDLVNTSKMIKEES